MSAPSNKTKPIDFGEGFGEAVSAGKRVWEHDRSQTVGASEVAGCWRRNYFAKREPELAELDESVDEWGHAERGNIIENEFVVPALRHMFGEDKCLYMGEEQKTFVDGRLSATPDGIVVDLSDDALRNYGVESLGGSGVLQTEVKTFGGDFAAPKKRVIPDPNDAAKNIILYEARPKHEAQNIAQMGIMRRETNYSPDVGVVLYVNPVNLKDVRVAPVKYDDAVYNRLKSRAEAVFDPNKTAKDFPAEGVMTTDCNYCAFCKACNDVEMKRMPDSPIASRDLPEETREAIGRLTREVEALRAEHKALSERKKVAEASLKDALFDSGTNRASGDGWSCSVSRNNGRKTTDLDAICEKYGIDLEEFQKVGQPYFVLRTKAE